MSHTRGSPHSLYQDAFVNTLGGPLKICVLYILLLINQIISTCESTKKLVGANRKHPGVDYKPGWAEAHSYKYIYWSIRCRNSEHVTNVRYVKRISLLLYQSGGKKIQQLKQNIILLCMMSLERFLKLVQLESVKWRPNKRVIPMMNVCTNATWILVRVAMVCDVSFLRCCTCNHMHYKCKSQLKCSNMKYRIIHCMPIPFYPVPSVLCWLRVVKIYPWVIPFLELRKSYKK